MTSSRYPWQGMNATRRPKRWCEAARQRRETASATARKQRTGRAIDVAWNLQIRIEVALHGPVLDSAGAAPRVRSDTEEPRMLQVVEEQQRSFVTQRRVVDRHLFSLESGRAGTLRRAIKHGAGAQKEPRRVGAVVDEHGVSRA